MTLAFHPATRVIEKLWHRRLFESRYHLHHHGHNSSYAIPKWCKMQMSIPSASSTHNTRSTLLTPWYVWFYTLSWWLTGSHERKKEQYMLKVHVARCCNDTVSPHGRKISRALFKRQLYAPGEVCGQAHSQALMAAGTATKPHKRVDLHPVSATWMSWF